MAITREKFKTYKNVFDEFTRRTVFKLSSEGLFDELKSPVAVGKESNVFTAERKDGSLAIVKIYRLETCDFNKMFDYLRYDSRFLNLKNQRRQVIFAWAEREYRNLMIARDAGVKVPTPLARRNNALVLEMIGKDSPAPRLKDKDPKDPKKFLDKLIREMRLLSDAGLVHGDLSEFNILNLDDAPVLIDFSQATVKKSQNYFELLERDCKNVARYFRKIGIKIETEELLGKITA